MENLTVWKFENQRVKEETFIQTGRRGGDGHLGGEYSLVARWWLEDWQSHICVQINREEQLGSETDHITQGSSAG